MNKYKIFWTDMHSNIHHYQIEELPKWVEHAKKTMDFWLVAYYPYYVRKDETGLNVEDIHPLEEISKDWEYIREITQYENDDGFSMFMGYEWQGAGLDGDHNIFFKNNNGKMNFPLRYSEVVELYRDEPVIGIPHHLAYQKGFRGKNWETHDENFSPFVEIYSSHGSNENDVTNLPMGRHIHMGPRTSETSGESGWNYGYKYGVIASGDNHHTPGVYRNGFAAVLAKSNSKEDIWDALVNRRVYGVTDNKIKMNFSIDNSIMGTTAKESDASNLFLDVEASNAIDRIEIIADNKIIEVINHTSTWEREKLDDVIKFKFELELGWGPDRRIFEDIFQKKWTGRLRTTGEILSVEKCWNNFGQSIKSLNNNSCDFELITYKTSDSGRWMGPSPITNEGFIFEIEDKLDSNIELELNGETYKFSILDLLKESRIIPLIEEAKVLLKERFQFQDYYRYDPWWHNAYKIKIHQAVPGISYTKKINKEINTKGIKHVRVKVIQRNGSVAWSSPIFIES